MAEIELTQAEAERLIALEKHRVNNESWDYPIAGGALSIPLISISKKENFFLDVHRGRINLSKATYQNRARQVVVLVRLDLDGAPHRNPDGTEIQCPHLHLYQEGFGDKWAVPMPADRFSISGDRWQLLQDFMRYCNISQPPLIQQGLF